MGWLVGIGGSGRAGVACRPIDISIAAQQQVDPLSLSNGAVCDASGARLHRRAAAAEREGARSRFPRRDREARPDIHQGAPSRLAVACPAENIFFNWWETDRRRGSDWRKDFSETNEGAQ